MLVLALASGGQLCGKPRTSGGPSAVARRHLEVDKKISEYGLYLLANDAIEVICCQHDLALNLVAKIRTQGPQKDRKPLPLPLRRIVDKLGKFSSTEAERIFSSSPIYGCKPSPLHPSGSICPYGAMDVLSARPPIS